MIYLYCLTVFPATEIFLIAEGSLSASRHHEIIISTGTALELYSLISKQGRNIQIFKTGMFSKIRALAAFRRAMIIVTMFC